MLERSCRFSRRLSSDPLLKAVISTLLTSTPPRLGPFQHIDAAHQCFCLAAEADDAEDLPRLDLEADIIQGPEFLGHRCISWSSGESQSNIPTPYFSNSFKISSKTEEDYTNHFNSVSHLSSVLTRHQQELAPAAAAAGFIGPVPPPLLIRARTAYRLFSC